VETKSDPKENRKGGGGRKKNRPAHKSGRRPGGWDPFPDSERGAPRPFGPKKRTTWLDEKPGKDRGQRENKFQSPGIVILTGKEKKEWEEGKKSGNDLKKHWEVAKRKPGGENRRGCIMTVMPSTKLKVGRTTAGKKGKESEPQKNAYYPGKFNLGLSSRGVHK